MTKVGYNKANLCLETMETPGRAEIVLLFIEPKFGRIKHPPVCCY